MPSPMKRPQSSMFQSGGRTPRDVAGAEAHGAGQCEVVPLADAVHPLQAACFGAPGPAALTAEAEPDENRVAIGTMHLAKGLEFGAVAVRACDDEVIPRQDRVKAITDQSDLDEVDATERHLLYVACTRARERLLVTAVEPASEFLDHRFL